MSRASIASSHQDHSLIDLTRLLASLERSMLLPHVSQSLQQSSLQRTRVGANIEFAHNLILQLEHANPPIKAQTPLSKLQGELQQKRVLLKKLQNRLYELSQLDNESPDSSASEDSDGEDLLSTYAPGFDISHSETDDQEDEATERSVVQEQPKVLEDTHLRSRRTLHNKPENNGATSGAAVNDRSRDLKLGGSTTAFPTESSRSDGEVLLSHHASEQETLTNSLLKHAIALKTSAQSFSDTLSSSNPLLDQTTSALDRNVGGMAAAERRMGMLRRVTEGRGWWARLSLYAKVALLWVSLILIMLVMPKLRF